MHEKCASFAAQTCPFVSGNKQSYSDRELDATQVKVNKLVDATVRPSKMFLLKCRTKTVRLVRVSGHVADCLIVVTIFAIEEKTKCDGQASESQSSVTQRIGL
jgi:hypothetical protein